jgi:hypothetical protein
VEDGWLKLIADRVPKSIHKFKKHLFKFLFTLKNTIPDV